MRTTPPAIRMRMVASMQRTLTPIRIRTRNTASRISMTTSTTTTMTMTTPTSREGWSASCATFSGRTALIQVAVVILSGSVALLADTVHNFADASTAIPLWLAFSLSRRPPNRRYTYGYGRAEDLAGVFVVLMIAASSAVAAWESVQ